MSTSVTDIQKLSIAFLGRPADPLTIETLAAQTLLQVATYLADSDEYAATYGEEDIETQINAAYKKLFNRDASLAETQYWLQQIEFQGLDLVAVLSEIDTSRDPDRVVFQAKLAASLGFTAALDTEIEKVGYSGPSPFALARDWLSKINDPIQSELQLQRQYLDESILRILGLQKRVIINSKTESIYEGESATFTLETIGFPSGTELFYSITGISASDIVGGAMSGIARIGSDGRASISIDVALDFLAEDAETLTMNVEGASKSITIQNILNPDTDDDNDAPSIRPEIVKYFREDKPINQSIVTIWASDPDGDDLKFYLADELHDEKFFYIDENSGDVFLRQPLRFEAPVDENFDNKYILHYKVTDGQIASYGVAKFIVQHQVDDEIYAGVIISEGQGPLIVGHFDPGSRIEIFSGPDLVDVIVVPENGLIEYRISTALVNADKLLSIKSYDTDGGERQVNLDPSRPELGYGGSDRADTLFGGAGSVLSGGPGDDKLYGYAPDVIAEYSGRSDNHRIIISPDQVTVVDKNQNEGVDELFGISRIGFSDTIVDVRDYVHLSQLDTNNIASLLQLYIACFNRAPDVHGLAYWGARLSEGVALEVIAQEFCEAPEFRSMYGVNESPYAFVARVYENVLGREPDAGGHEFWAQALETNSLTPESFLITFIKSALDQCDPNDAQFIINRSIVAAEFSLRAGLADAELGYDLMRMVDQNTETVQEAFTRIETARSLAFEDPNQLVVQIIGLA